MSLVERVTDYGFTLYRNLRQRYEDLTYAGKCLIWVYVSLHFVVGFLVWWITPATLFAWMAGWAESLSEMRGGSLLLVGLIIVTSFPPIFGYGTCVTLAGFAFGPYHGWVVGATGCLIGGALSFLGIRQMLSLYLPYMNQNRTFKALSRAMSVKGMTLIILVRLMPLSYPYSNLLMASTESVTFGQFMLATLAITPKLFLHVWTGSRMYAFADPTSRSRMDTKAKWVNAIFIALASAVGMATSWYLYRLTMRYVEEAELSLGEEGDLEAGLLEREVDEMLDDEESEDGAGREREGQPERLEEGVTPRAEVKRTLSGGAGREAVPLRPISHHTQSHSQSHPLERAGSSTSYHSEARQEETGTGPVRQSEDWGETEFSDFEDKGKAGGAEETDDDGAGWGLDEEDVQEEESEGDRSPPRKGKDKWLD